MEFDRIVIGVDVGLSGAIAAVSGLGELVGVWDMPVETVGNGKHRCAPFLLYQILCNIRARAAFVECRIEQVGAMPSQGVTSMFNFGDSFGCVRSAVAVAGIPHAFITPQSWKKQCGLIGTDKDFSRTKAAQLFSSAPLSLKKHIGWADALLIAWSGL